MAKVAFLGLGVMGYPMAGHLVKAGHDVTVFNRTAAKAEAWAKQHGGSHASTPREAAAGCDFVMSCVGNDDDLRSVCLGEDGAFAGMAKGSIFVDHTTVSAKVTKELYEASADLGIAFVDAPISGGQAGAENGVLSVMCGGDQAAYDSAAPVIDAYARIWPDDQDVQPDRHRGSGTGAERSAAFRRKGGAGRSCRGRSDQPRGCRIVADVEPLRDHDRRQVHPWLCCRLDAQGFGDCDGRRT